MSDRGQPREILTWEDFGVGGRELAQLVRDDGFDPTVVLAIARGGLPVAGTRLLRAGPQELLRDQRRVLHGRRRKARRTGHPPARAQPRRPRPREGARCRRRGRYRRDASAGRRDGPTEVAELRTAVLYEKPRSVVRCDYVWRRT